MRHIQVLTLALAAFAIAAFAQPQASQVADNDQPFGISVNVDLVVLHASVRDRHGRTVSDLHRPDFEVYEDGVRQAIRTFKQEDIAVTVGLVVDHSGSMRQKLPRVMAAARSFVKSSNPEDEMFVVNFNENVTMGLPAGVRFTRDADELGAAVLNAPAAGQTALYDAIGAALQRLQSAGHEKKVLIVISDGSDNASVLGLPDLLRKVEGDNVLLYAVGIFASDDPDRNPRVLRRLATATGGEGFFPQEPDEVTAVCERIARDIRSQYTIGYLSNAAQPTGVYRSIRVTVPRSTAGKLSVRTRSGYMPAGEQQAGPSR